MSNVDDRVVSGGMGPDDLERNGEAIRAEMDRTLDALERKLSPGQLLDRSVRYVQEHGGPVARQVSDTVRRHPIPILAAAGSLIWLTASILAARSSGRRSSSMGRAAPRSTFESASTTSNASSNGEGSGNASTGSNTNGTLQRAKQKTQGALHATRDRVQQASEQIGYTVREQPLIFGGLALAAGALIGAMLPATEYERRALGPTHDRAIDKARDFGERQYQRIVHGGGETQRAAGETTEERQGNGQHFQ
jgi:ElaB/YqjD/DUF883 family membrane-anchored ribosome-binding protein